MFIIQFNTMMEMYPVHIFTRNCILFTVYVHCTQTSAWSAPLRPAGADTAATPRTFIILISPPRLTNIKPLKRCTLIFLYFKCLLYIYRSISELYVVRFITMSDCHVWVREGD